MDLYGEIVGFKKWYKGTAVELFYYTTKPWLLEVDFG